MDQPLLPLTSAAQPADDPARSTGALLADACIWLSHRAGSLAALLVVMGVAAAVTGQWVSVLFLWAFASADIGVLATAIAQLLRRRISRPVQAAGPGIFNLVLVLAALTLYLVALKMRDL